MLKRCLLLAPRPVCGQTHMCQKRGKREICQRSPPSLPTPKSGEQRANGRSLSPIRPPSFTSGGSLRRGINTNHEKPPPPPKPKEGHVKITSLRKS